MIESKRSHLTVKAATHAGLSGKNNEDRYAVCAFELEDGQHTPSVLAVVADGIGGHRAGEVAAELATEIICQNVAQSDAQQPTRVLEQAVIRAGEIIAASAQRDVIQKGMGTTCACAWVIGEKLYTASAGDSRIYLIRKGQILQLTTDHTWVQEAIDRGVIHPDEARTHPNAHVIRRYLGSTQPVVPDMGLRMDAGMNGEVDQNQGASLLPDDVLLLCTDGLTDLVQDEEILEVIERRGAQAGVPELVDLANRRGGHDNITIITLGVPGRQKASFIQLKTAQNWRITAGCLTALAVLSIALFVGGYWFLNSIQPAGAGSTPSPLNPRVTLFPEQGSRNGNEVLPTAIPAGATLAVTPLSSEGTQEIDTSALPGVFPTMVGATLTPWPTNIP